MAGVFQNRTSLCLRVGVWASALLVGALFVWMTGYVLFTGLPCLSWSQFAWVYTTNNHSMLPAIVVTCIMVFLGLLFAAPAGIGAAIYLTEYAPAHSRFAAMIRLAADSLAAIPSIVYGLFGFLFFVVALGFGFSILAGALTLAIMVLPLLMRTAEEALKSVPDVWREGSLALGAGKLQTVCKVVLPAAIPGVFAGIILSMGRIVGESAALLYTAGTVAAIPDSVFASGRTLSVHLYALLSEGLFMREAHATAVILLCVPLGINLVAAYVAKTLMRRE